jgi:predicted permease
MDLGQTGRTVPEVDALVRQMRARVRGLAGVENAAAAVTVAGLGSWGGRISIPGIDSLPSTAGGPFFNAVESGFFATMGIRFVRGRPFTDAEEQSGARVVVVNETLARAAWPNDNPIGKCIRVGADTAPCSDVVGVIENTRRQDWIEDDIYHVHLPLSRATANMRQRVLVVRPSGRNPARMIEPVRRAMQTTAPNLAFASVTPLTARFASELRPWRLGAAMFSAFGALAVILAALGVYAVVSFSVSQRIHEIGVRMALGAQRWNVVRLVTRQGVTLAGVGAALGIFAAGVSARIVAPLLFQVSPRDPLVFGAAATTLMLVAVAATLFPARRAAGVSPIVALRSEE